MGEHPNDKSTEQILEEEAQQKALEQAKREAEELRSNAVLDNNVQLREKRRKAILSRLPDRNAVIVWFYLEEKDRKTVVDGSNGRAAIWFHGT